MRVREARTQSPRPSGEREGPVAKQREGEGMAPRHPASPGKTAAAEPPPHPPGAPRRAPPSPRWGEGIKERLRCLTAASLLLALASPLAAYACPDLASAPSTRWTLRTEHGVATLVTPCGESFYSNGVNVVDGEIPKKPMPGHQGYDWQRYYPSLAAWREATLRRMADWGFNSAGAWSLPPEYLKLPAIPNLEIGRLSRF